MTQLTYTFSIQLANSLRRMVTGNIEVSAYDVINVTVPPAASAGSPATEEVNLLSTDGANAVTFLMVVSDVYSDLSYKVDTATSSHDIDGPHLLIGAGAVSLLESAPSSLTFSNASTTTAANLEIIIGRDV